MLKTFLCAKSVPRSQGFQVKIDFLLFELERCLTDFCTLQPFNAYLSNTSDTMKTKEQKIEQRIQ